MFSVAEKLLRAGIMKISIILIFSLWLLWMKIRCTKADKPGSFFWRPRVGLAFTIPKEKKAPGEKTGMKPTVNEIKQGYAVLINSYELGTTVLGLAAGIEDWEKYPQFNPFKAWFYTTAYRWLLRHLSIYPEWLRGGGFTYVDTHRVWRKRFTQMETWVPKWMQKMLFWVWEFDRERKQFRRYKRYASPAFGKHSHYPGVTFDNFKSEETTETIENLDYLDRSIDFNVPDY